MMASTTFFRAPGWVGLRGAVFLASSMRAPISWSSPRLNPLRTLGNQSFSSSSMWWGDVLDEDPHLGVEPLSVGPRGEEVHDHDVGHVVLLVRLQDIALELGQERAYPRVHELILQERMHC